MIVQSANEELDITERTKLLSFQKSGIIEYESAFGEFMAIQMLRNVMRLSSVE